LGCDLQQICQPLLGQAFFFSLGGNDSADIFCLIVAHDFLPRLLLSAGNVIVPQVFPFFNNRPVGVFVSVPRAKPTQLLFLQRAVVQRSVVSPTSPLLHTLPLKGRQGKPDFRRTSCYERNGLIYGMLRFSVWR
jgi:hypothetical protein